MKKNEMKDEKIMPLNETLPDFYLEDLEERLETDPLAIGNLFKTELASDGCIIESSCNPDGTCGEKHNCTGHW